MEFLKLKRSNIFSLSIIGAIIPAFLMFIAVTAFGEEETFEAFFTNINMYMSALFAVLLFAIIISYLFGREYNEKGRLIYEVYFYDGKKYFSKINKIN